jgi:DNA-binding response OmpR family regulator
VAAGQALRRQGFQVSEAESGERALELIPMDHPDLVILDLKMGGMDGISTLTEIRRLDADLPVSSSRATAGTRTPWPESTWAWWTSSRSLWT